MIAPDADPIESHDLPDHPKVDHVVIYPNADPDEPHFEAVPFVLAGTFEDGTDHYDELAEFDPTPEYREAVLDHTDLDAESIKFDRPPLATDTLEL